MNSPPSHDDVGGFDFDFRDRDSTCITHRQDVDDDDVEGITPEQIDALADQSMPLCMQQLHYALKRDHKLKHWV